MILKPVKVVKNPLSNISKRIPPKCENCLYVMKENNIPVCRLFKYYTVTLSDKNNFHYYMDTNTCRFDKDLCGPDAEYFKPKQ